MEASGYGRGAGVLARICQIHHTPFLILSSHVARLGEMYYFHSETHYLGEPILRGIGIPFAVVQRIDAAELGIPFDMDFLAVSNDFYKRSTATVERIVGGYAEGMGALRTDKPKALAALEKYMRDRGGSVEENYQYVIRYLSPIPTVDPAAVEAVLKMIGQTSAPGLKIYDNSIMDRLVQEKQIERMKK